jgi:outer membrane protein TolC
MTERATRTSSSIAIALCTAAASLVASPARALQPLETFLSAARERNPDAQQARANLDQQDAEAFTTLGRQLPGVSVRANYYRNQYQTQIVLEGKEIPVQPGTSGSAPRR